MSRDLILASFDLGVVSAKLELLRWVVSTDMPLTIEAARVLIAKLEQLEVLYPEAVPPTNSPEPVAPTGTECSGTALMTKE